MQHTKFKGHRSFSSREGFTIYGHGGHFGNVTWTVRTNLRSSHPMEFPRELWLQSAERFPRTRSLKMLNLSDLGPRSMNDLDL